MPLPSMKKAKRCTAKAKSTGQQCNNPVKGRTGKVCRLHGWRSKETVRLGSNHPQYVHGEATKEARAELKQLGELKKALKQKKLI